MRYHNSFLSDVHPSLTEYSARSSERHVAGPRYINVSRVVVTEVERLPLFIH
jgi:hypothetical protein